MKQRILILDTQVFEKLRLDFQHSQFIRLEELKKDFDFQLAIPEMVELEIKKKLKERLTELDNSLKKYKSLPRYFKIKPCELDAAINQANIAFEKFKKEYDVKVLKHNIIACDELVKLYIKQQPPFSSGKKNEFPDAISLLSIDHTTFKYKDIISGDKDWISYYSNKNDVKTYDSIPEYIDKKLQETSNYVLKLKQKFLSAANSQFLLDNLIENFEDKFDKKFSFSIYLNSKLQNISPSDCYNFKIKEINITNVKPFTYETSKGTKYCNGERCFVDVKLQFDVPLDFGRVEQVVNGLKIEIPKIKVITLETNVEGVAGIEEQSVTSFTFGGISQTEWYLEFDN